MASAVCWLLILTFVDETFYDRQIPVAQQPKRKSRLLRLVGVEQWKTRHQRSSFGRALLRPFVAVFKLPVFLSFLYYVFTFAWVIGLNTQISVFLTSPKLYAFNDKDIGIPPIPQNTRTTPNLTYLSTRPLLLRPHRRNHPRRNRRPLGSRPSRHHLHPPQRPLRARIPPPSYLLRHPHHDHRHRARRLWPAAYMALHGDRGQHGPFRFRYHDHHHRHQRLRA